MFSFNFFSLPLIFTLHWWPLGFLIFSPPLKNLHVVFPTKNESPSFFISRSRSLLPFLSLRFAGLPPKFSFSLSFSSSIVEICGHDDTDTETISAFRVFVLIDSLVVFALQDAGGYAISLQNNFELHLGCHIC